MLQCHTRPVATVGISQTEVSPTGLHPSPYTNHAEGDEDAADEPAAEHGGSVPQSVKGRRGAIRRHSSALAAASEAAGALGGLRVDLGADGVYDTPKLRLFITSKRM